MKRNHWTLRATLISAAIIACATTSLASAQVSIKVLSNRADLISGGDALVEVALPLGLSINPVYIPAFIKATVDGVCDWTKPGVGQTNAQPTKFANGPGWQPLPPPPVSTPL
jgi:hypothetical protein